MAAVTMEEIQEKMQNMMQDVNEKMEELSNKIEKERTDAADTRTNLADEFIRQRDEIKDTNARTMSMSGDLGQYVSDVIEANNRFKTIENKHE